MLFETRSGNPEARYRARLSAAGAAQSRDQVPAGEPSTTACALERAKAQWLALERQVRAQTEPSSSTCAQGLS
jgi:hypothetical protein